MAMIFVTPAQVAQMVGTSESSVRRWEAVGELPPAERVNARGDRRWRLSDITHYVRERESQNPLRNCCPQCGYSVTRRGTERSISDLVELAEAFVAEYGWVSADMLSRRLRIPHAWAELLVLQLRQNHSP